MSYSWPGMGSSLWKMPNTCFELKCTIMGTGLISYYTQLLMPSYSSWMKIYSFRMQVIKRCQQGERQGYISRTVTYSFVCSLSEENGSHIYSSKRIRVAECKEKLIFNQIDPRLLSFSSTIKIEATNVYMTLSAEIKNFFNTLCLDIKWEYIISLDFSLSAHPQGHQKCIRIESTKRLIEDRNIYNWK